MDCFDLTFDIKFNRQFEVDPGGYDAEFGIGRVEGEDSTLKSQGAEGAIVLWKGKE